jgi:raffinose/stachyose/melibiose transport system substrate-binding protein
MIDAEKLLKDLGLYDQYRPSALAYQRFDDGSLYMIPFEYGAELFWYNKALFAKAGVKIPASLDDFPAMCEKLRAAGTTPIAIDGADQWPLERWIAYQPFRTDGPSYVKSLKSADAKFSDPAGQKSAEWLSALGKAQCFEEGFSSVGYVDAENLFTTGKAAIYNMGTWELGALATDSLDASIRDDVDFFTLPTVEDSATQPNEYVAPSGIGMAVNAKTYDPLVRDFLKFALTRYPDEYAANGALGPTTVDPKIPANATPLYQKAIDTANDAGSETIMPWDTQLDPTTNTMLQQELTLLVQGEITADEFVSKMDDTLEQNAPKYFK